MADRWPIRRWRAERAIGDDSGDAVVLRTGRPSARLLNDLAQVLIARAGATHASRDAGPNGTGP